MSPKRGVIILGPAYRDAVTLHNLQRLRVRRTMIQSRLSLLPSAEEHRRPSGWRLVMAAII